MTLASYPHPPEASVSRAMNSSFSLIVILSFLSLIVLSSMFSHCSLIVVLSLSFSHCCSLCWPTIRHPSRWTLEPEENPQEVFASWTGGQAAARKDNGKVGEAASRGARVVASGEGREAAGTSGPTPASASDVAGCYDTVEGRVSMHAEPSDESALLPGPAAGVGVTPIEERRKHRPWWQSSDYPQDEVPR